MISLNLSKRFNMTPRQAQQNLIGWVFKWIDKYGFPTVAIVFLYFDFIYPMKEERREMTKVVSQVVATQAKMTDQIVENQRLTIENQHQIINNQKDIMNSSRTMIRILEEHNLEIHTKPEDREKELRKFLERGECLADPELQLEVLEHLNLTTDLLESTKVN